jgi:hypothetical protein
MAAVTFVANLQPAPACYPPDVNALLTLIANQGLSGTVPDNSGGGIYVGSVAPSSSLTQKVWFKIDAAGRPLGIYMFYNGNWRKVYMGAYGDVKMFAGSPSGRFDGTGRGVVGGDQDGWALCNGNNGTPNLANRFIVGSTGFDGAGWPTSVDGVARYSGGIGTFVIQPSNLPQMIVQAFAYQHGPTGPAGQGNLVGAPSDIAVANWPVISGGAPVGGSVPMNNCPPYYSMAFCMFIGYA